MSSIPETVSFHRDTPTLSPEHRRKLEEESGISPDVIAERGVRTIKHGRELPKGFAWRQRRRAPGLLFDVHRPNGETDYIFRPDDPDPENLGLKYEARCKAYGAPGNVLDVHPSLHHLITDVSAPVLFAEGIKKTDSFTTAARSDGVAVLTVAISGVWNWLSDGEPIPDMFDIPVEGRQVIIGFDSDMLRNPDVQDAARRFAEHLISRGAEVWIIYLPDKPDGSKMGLDDFFASEAGGTIAELRLLMRRYDPSEADFVTVRLSRNQRLGAAIEDLRAACQAMPTVKVGECSDQAAMRDFIRAAQRSGKLVEDGVWVIRSARDGADGAQMSLGGWKNAVDRLEAAGRIRRDFWGRTKDKPGAYVLLTPSGGGGVQGEHNGDTESGQGGADHRGETFSAFSGQVHRGVHVARAPFTDEVPELRWPKVILSWERREGRRVVVDSEYVARLGKRRREIIAYLWEAGGSAAVEDLRAEYGARRGSLRDFRRWILAPLTGWRYDRKLKRWSQFGPPIITLEGDSVQLVAEWREALERHRDEAGEIEDAKRQAERHQREKQAFRRAAATPADPTPATKGREHVRRTLEHHRPRWAKEQADELRRMVEPAKAFVSATLDGLDHIRLGLLEDMWSEAGGQRWHLRLALRELRCRPRRHAEYPGEWFVYPPAGDGESHAEPEHPWHCDCPECGPEPSYVQLREMA